jgi:hypothetical protein
MSNYTNNNSSYDEIERAIHPETTTENNQDNDINSGNSIDEAQYEHNHLLHTTGTECSASSDTGRTSIGGSGDDNDNTNLNVSHHGIVGTSTSHGLDDFNDLELQNSSSLRMSTKQKIMNAMHKMIPIKQTYERLNNGLTTGRMHTNAPGRFIGQGTDGVFRNLAAKPETDSTLQAQEINPPTYEDASADNAPEYWESTMVSPMYGDEVFVEGLPVGNLANLVWISIVTVAFQFLGFVLCYLLHTSHAGKHGARAGLGITFIVYSYGMIPTNFGHVDKLPDKLIVENPNDFDITRATSLKGTLDNYQSDLFQQRPTSEAVLNGYSTTPYFAYGVIAFGIFLLLKALSDFYKIKVMERNILAPSQHSETVTSTTEMTESPNLED